MPEKPKNDRRSFRTRLFDLAKLTLAGVFLLALIGAIAAAVLSVAQRYRSPEDALSAYPQPRVHDGAWYETDTEPRVISDVKVTQRIVRNDMDALQFVLTWLEDPASHCASSLLMQEMKDIFGGWRVLRYSRGGCSSGSLGGGAGYYDFWESAPWELPRYYYFAYTGTTPDEGMIEIEFGDGSRASAISREDSVGMVVRRSAPFYIETVNYLDDAGKLLYSIPG